MNRTEKKELVTALHDVFKDTGVVVVAHYAGMTVSQMTDFRQRIKEAGGAVRVAKNRLAMLAVKDTDSAPIAGLFKGPTCVAYSKDPIAAARIAVRYSRENDKLVILGGAMGTTVLDASGVKALADLPSLDELRAMLMGLIKAPAEKLVRTLNEPAAQLVRALQARVDKEGKAA